MVLGVVICCVGLLILLALPGNSADDEQVISTRWWLRFLALWLLATGVLVTLISIAVWVLRFMM
jgi:hypothetical protein